MTTPFEFRNLPASKVARPVDRIVGDLDGRLWMRIVLPGEEREHWEVWNTSGPTRAFSVVLRKGEALLDAAGFKMLLRTKDEHDVDYVLVREFGEVTTGKNGLANWQDYAPRSEAAMRWPLSLGAFARRFSAGPV